LKYLVVGLVVLAVTSLVADRCYSSRASEWEARVVAVQRVADEHRQRAEAAEVEAEKLRSQAAAIAEAAEARQPVIDTMIVRLPPAETPGEAQRDTIITELQTQVQTWKSAYQKQLEAGAVLRVALGEMTARGDSLEAVLADRPTKKPWWIPEVVMGPFAGLCSEGRPCAGVGVALGWKIGGP
jgi:hypothetical protein